MSDPDFDRLKNSRAPEPSEGAERRAVFAALEAFDEAAAKKSRDALKGSRGRDRQTSSPSWVWRIIMDNRLAIGGVAVCLIAAPLSIALLTQQTMPPVGGSGPTANIEPPKPQPSPQQDVGAAQKSREDSVANLAKPAKPPLAEIRVEAEIAAPPPPPAGVSPQAEDRSRMLTRQQQSYAKREMAPGLVAPSPAPVDAYMAQEGGRDRFVDGPANGVKTTTQEPVSTFSIDADTASYSWVRRALMQGRAPAPVEVRVEELINYFPYGYAAPTSADAPFKPTVSVYPTPWNKDTRIVHIGLKGFEAPVAAQPKANLVFLIDVSGSMSSADKLPLVKASLKLLLGRLKPDDSVSIVTYAGGTGIALEPTKASDRETITAAIDRLQAGGGTAGAAGIEEAYRMARKNFDAKGINRVMLATDGDFNVGTSDDDGLQRLVEQQRKSGVYLSVLGFGQGNYQDAVMQRLAQNGNGTAAYIDQLEEAQKVLVEEATQTLFPIAKDVKIQVEFNPATVAEYRLIGYETRALKREDFKDDKVDAGEVGSGSAVTALYEITPVGSPARLTEDLRYGAPAKPAASASEDYGYLKLRYKLPSEETSREISQAIGKADEAASLAGAPDDIRFAAAVAAFGQKLKGDRRVSGMRWDEIATLAAGARGEDRWGYRAGFARLVGLAKGVAPQ